MCLKKQKQTKGKAFYFKLLFTNTSENYKHFPSVAFSRKSSPRKKSRQRVPGSRDTGGLSRAGTWLSEPWRRADSRAPGHVLGRGQS